MSNGDFFGINENQQVQDLSEGEGSGGKKGRFGRFGRGGGGSAPAGSKIIMICIIVSLVFAMVCSWVMVQMIGASKSSVNNAMNDAAIVAANLSAFEKDTLGTMGTKADQTWVTNQGFAKTTYVDSKVTDMAHTADITALNTTLTNALANFSVPASNRITLLSGGCNVSINGSVVSNVGVNVSSQKMWNIPYTSACVMNLTATSDAGHTYYGTFAGWEVNGLLYTSNPISLNISGETLITALSSGTGNMVSYTLTYTAGANGTISGVTNQTVYRGGNGTQVTAVAISNYAFVNWSDASTANPRTDTNVLSNIAVTANFASCLATAPTFISPSNGVNVSVGIGTVNLSWSQSNAVSYVVNVFGGAIPVRSFTPTTNYVSIPVTVNTSYFWQVGAVGACGGTVLNSSFWSFNVVP